MRIPAALYHELHDLEDELGYDNYLRVAFVQAEPRWTPKRTFATLYLSIDARRELRKNLENYLDVWQDQLGWGEPEQDRHYGRLIRQGRKLLQSL